MHPFDEAIALSRDAEGVFHGRTTPEYWNMVGPFGGITAAVLLHAVLQHPARLGEPAAMTVNFAGPVPEGPFRLLVRPVRTNRSTQHWIIEQHVQDADGGTSIATTATVLTAARRQTWSASDFSAPLQGGPQADQPPMALPPGVPSWFRQYAFVPLEGEMPGAWDGREREGSLSRLWVRKAAERALDFCALAAFCDVFYPRVWLRRAHRVPAGTVSITVYFHASGAMLDAAGSDWLLAQAQGQEFRDTLFDQTGQVWDRHGNMLATTHQIAYFKE
ncbi:thioesterase family protein [Corticibacter populi]|uniref:Thioesterase family protein n=1 Tax=Corticibacter populi TaxID=1550736 RepID=A0A3M6QP65_9BURK|nr:thioesterase family protein [Corticibacter populi]RMX04836.1 thioesterase family protein [Corticibacter populi]RZS33745.1 acyl-CoA thioesterase [Corticibacter populi]